MIHIMPIFCNVDFYTFPVLQWHITPTHYNFAFLLLHFYRATACNATQGTAIAILSVCLSDACIVTKLNHGLRMFLYHTIWQSL